MHVYCFGFLRIAQTLGENRPKIQPKPSDLSYYNFETQHSTSNSNSNFQIIAHNEMGLLFKNKRDRKTINVDPNALPGKVCLLACLLACVCVLLLCCVGLNEGLVCHAIRTSFLLLG